MNTNMFNNYLIIEQNMYKLRDHITFRGVFAQKTGQ